MDAMFIQNLSSKLQRKMVRRILAIEQHLLKKKKKSAPFFKDNFVHNKRLSDSSGTGKVLLAVLCGFDTYSRATRDPR